MKMCHEIVGHEGQDVLVVSFSGVIAPGSEGNEDGVRGSKYIEALMEEECAALVLDLTDLDYEFGDYAASWIGVPRLRREDLPVRVAASGRTGDAMTSLLRASGIAFMVGEPLTHASVDQALGSLP